MPVTTGNLAPQMDPDAEHGFIETSSYRKNAVGVRRLVAGPDGKGVFYPVRTPFFWANERLGRLVTMLSTAAVNMDLLPLKKFHDQIEEIEFWASLHGKALFRKLYVCTEDVISFTELDEREQARRQYCGTRIRQFDVPGKSKPWLACTRKATHVAESYGGDFYFACNAHPFDVSDPRLKSVRRLRYGKSKKRGVK